MPLIILHMSKLATGLQRNCRSYVFLNKQALKYQNIIKIEEMKNKLITFLALSGILFVSCSNTSKKVLRMILFKAHNQLQMKKQNPYYLHLN